jgi:hypothetical protein
MSESTWYPGKLDQESTWASGPAVCVNGRERPITINQAWADGWGPRYQAAKAEVKRRLEVCEAQTPGRWVAVSGGGYVSIAISHPCEIAEKIPGSVYGDGLNQNARNYIAMAHQRTERPQELRILDALLDMLNEVAFGPRPFAQSSVAERGLRIVEKELLVDCGEKA